MLSIRGERLMSPIRTGYAQQDNLHECSELLNKNIKKILPRRKEVKQPDFEWEGQQDPTQLRKFEILSFTKELKSFGISFSTLTTKSPKNLECRDCAFMVAKKVSADIELTNALMAQKQLPIEELMKKTKISNDFFIKHRAYIIAMSLLLLGNYQQLQSFLVGGVHI